MTACYSVSFKNNQFYAIQRVELNQSLTSFGLLERVEEHGVVTYTMLFDRHQDESALKSFAPILDAVMKLKKAYENQ